jgi:hypothetical protein
MKKFKVIFENYSKASLDDFYNDFDLIWERDNTERSIFDLWLHIVDHAGRIAKAVKNDNPPAVIDDLADTTVWLMSFISFINRLSEDENYITPSEIIWNKYPMVCSSCLEIFLIEEFDLLNKNNSIEFISQNKTIISDFLKQNSEKLSSKKCDCFTKTNRQQEINNLRSLLKNEFDNLRIEYAKNNSLNKNQFDGFAKIEIMFESIFSTYLDFKSLEDITFELLNEIGEASQAIVNLYTYDESREPFSVELSKKRKQRLFDKIADVFYFLFACSIKIRKTYAKIASSYFQTITKNQEVNNKQFYFTDIIWSKYGMTKNGGNWSNLKCPGCANSPCACPRDLKLNWSETNQLFSDMLPKTKIIEKSTEKDIVFISYSHKDEKMLSELRIVLHPLIRNKQISLWDDTRIEAGKYWREEIESALSRAKVAILLVSQHFLASDFINDNELPQLLTKSTDGATKICWIPISDSLYTETEIEKYQALHSPSNPLDKYPKNKRNSIWVEISKKIKEYANK